MPRDHILAIDLGTSSIKFLTLDRELRTGMVRSAPHNPNDASDDLHVDTWLTTIREVVHQIGDEEPWGAIAITGQMHGLVPLLEGCFGTGMSWTDTRGADLIPAMNRLLGDDLSTRIGGKLAPGFQAVHLEWLKRHRHNDWKRMTGAMLPKDALIHALTGRHVTDPSDAAGTGLFDAANGIWAQTVNDALGIPREWLPEIVPSGTLVGHVTGDAARRSGIASGTSVIIAGGDAPVGAIGAGISQPGQAMIILSTGAQIILPTATYEPDHDGRWYTWPSARPSSSNLAPWLRIGTLLNSGIAINWLRDVLNPDMNPVPHAQPSGLITLPYLSGERTPLNDPHARGAILGLTSQTTRQEIVRSMLEGIAYALRLAFETMTTGGAPPDVLAIGGGGTNVPGLQQIITDTLGIPTERFTSTETTAYGAALIAADTLGWQSLDQVPNSANSVTSILPPDPGRHQQYSELFEIYEHAADRVAPISHQIAVWRESRS